MVKVSGRSASIMTAVISFCRGQRLIKLVWVSGVELVGRMGAIARSRQLQAPLWRQPIGRNAVWRERGAD